VATAQTGQYISPGFQPNQGGHYQFPNGDFSSRGSIVGGRLVGGQIQAAIYAQVQKGQGKIVSRPRIAAQSGSTAKIITGDALPILTSITLSGVNGVSQQVQYVNVGVTLQIAPRVASDGFVSSHVFCVVSSVTGFSQGYPTISQRQAETSATVRDGDSFVIGGLTQESSITTRSKIPVLGDVPLFGQAFRTDRGTKSKTELYIVVTPHVVRRYGANAAPVQPAVPLPGTNGGELPPISEPPAGNP
jgi:general secretion pathway protein D